MLSPWSTGTGIRSVRQAHCQELLTTHYGHTSSKSSPIEMAATAGWKPTSPTTGTLLQRYVPDNPYTVTQQTESQKAKIRTDTKKLLDDPARIVRLIGAGNKVTQWVLLTPAFDKRCVDRVCQYALGQGVRTRRVAGLACGDTFRISVHDDSLFAAARAALAGTGTAPAWSGHPSR